MRLQDIRDGFLKAAKTLEQINPKIECYIVAMVGNQQFMAQDLAKGSDALLVLPKNSDLDQSSSSIKALVREGEEIKKSGKKISKELKSQRTAFEKTLETLEFNTLTYELRFYKIDIEAIQEIKTHPLIQAIGKTNMSTASINIVIV
jgi:DNA-binding NarL/FixJ family response regulator